MASIGSNIPLIAVTPEDDNIESSSADEESSSKINDSKTDVEDLYDSDKEGKNIRESAKHKNIDSTDSEEIEGIIENVIILHESPIDIDQVLQNDPLTYEQTFNADLNTKRKLQTQLSTQKEPQNLLAVDDDEQNGGITDVEDFETSNDELDDTKYPETELPEEIFDQTFTVQSSERNNSEDNKFGSEPKKAFKRTRKIKGTVRKSNTTHLTPRSLSPQLSDITDTEVIQSDSDNESSDGVPQRRTNRKYLSISNKEKEKDLTDDEMVLLSDTENQSPQYSKYKFKRNKSNMTAANKLFVNEPDVEHLTDVEEYSDEDGIDPESIVNVDETKMLEYLEAATSACGSITEVANEKNIYNPYISETYEVPSTSNEEQLTDVENYESEDNLIDTYIPVDSQIDIKFIRPNANSLSPNTAKNKKSQLKSKKNLDEEETWTDEENIKSSGDESTDNQPFPIAVITTNGNHTDSEMIEAEGDITTPPTSPISDTELPSPVREIIHIRVDENGQPHSYIEELRQDVVLGLDEKDEGNVTDTEVVSITEDLIASETEELDNNNILLEMENQCVDQREQVISLPKKQKTLIRQQLVLPDQDDEPMTDSEVVVFDSNSRKRRTKKSKNTNISENNNDLTDVEELIINDSNQKSQNNPNLLTVGKTESLPEIKTDVEEISDDESYLKQPSPHRALSVTPEMLRNMQNEYIITKETDKLTFTSSLQIPKSQQNLTSPEGQYTDTEDVFTSADEDVTVNISRENSDLSEFKTEFDAASNSHVHIKYSGKFDETEEILHIKGGGYIFNNATDVEDIGLSDDDYKNVENQGTISLASFIKTPFNKYKYHTIDNFNICNFCFPKIISFAVDTSSVGYTTKIFIIPSILSTQSIALFYFNQPYVVELDKINLLLLPKVHPKKQIKEKPMSPVRAHSSGVLQFSSEFNLHKELHSNTLEKYHSGNVSQIILQFEEMSLSSSSSSLPKAIPTLEVNGPDTEPDTRTSSEKEMESYLPQHDNYLPQKASLSSSEDDSQNDKKTKYFKPIVPIINMINRSISPKRLDPAPIQYSDAYKVFNKVEQTITTKYSSRIKPDFIAKIDNIKIPIQRSKSMIEKVQKFEELCIIRQHKSGSLPRHCYSNQNSKIKREWSPASVADIDKQYATSDAVSDKGVSQQEIGQTVIELTTCVPKPKPRATKPSDTQVEKLPIESEQRLEKEEQAEDKSVVTTGADKDSVLESYSERKKFWEQVSGSTENKTTIKDHMQTIIHDIPPVPKPRSTLHASSRSSSESIFYKTDGKSDSDEKTSIEKTLYSSDQGETETLYDSAGTIDDPCGYKPVSEYMASFQHPFLTTEKVDQLQSDETYTSEDTETKSSTFLPETSTLITHTEKSYKHFAKDLSVDQPPKVMQRKTLFERSTSLPTEDLHISDLSVKEKKSYFEQQIRKEMIVEQLMAQPEEEAAPEVKTIEVPHLHLEQDVIEESKSEPKEVLKTESIKHMQESERKVEKRSSTESDQSISSERSVEIELGEQTKEQLNEVLMYKSESTSRPSDSLEVHVDKSELEDSEKINDFDITDFENKSEWDTRSELSANNIIDDDKDSERDSVFESQAVLVSEEQIPQTVWEVPVVTEIDATAETISYLKDIESDKLPEDKENLKIINETKEITKEEHLDVSEIEQKPLPVLETEAREVAEEVVTDLEQEIQRSFDLNAPKKEPPAPDPEIAQNQVSEYLRQLAEAKGLDEREFELVESVLARKQRELLKMTRTDTQTSSMEITDEDLRCSGAETDISLESQILPEEETEIPIARTKPDLTAVNKTLEEVQESLHAAQEELIERGIHKKPSPSEFQFKISQVKLTDEEIQLMHDRIGIISEFYKTAQNEKSKMDKTDIKNEAILIDEDVEPEKFESDEKFEQNEKLVSDKPKSIQKEERIQSEYTDNKKCTIETMQTTTNIAGKEDQQITSATPIITKIMGHVRSSSEDSTIEESFKSPEDQSISSGRKEDSDTVSQLDNREVLLRKTRKHDSSATLKPDRKSGTDFEGWSSSGESHYHSFDLDSSKSRPCSSDVEGLLAAGSSEYESALTSQDISSKSHLTSAEYHTAISSLSSRESMKSLDSESSGHLASVEVSEASETLVPSTMEMEGDILDEQQSTLDDEEYDFVMKTVIDSKGEFSAERSYGKDTKYTATEATQVHSQQSEDTTIDDESITVPISGQPEIMSRMKRSHEMTFQPELKILSTDSPVSETVENLEDKYSSSVEEGSILSVSYSSTSDISVAKTVIECSDAELNDTIEQLRTELNIDETKTEIQSSKQNGPVQTDYVPEYDEVIEPKRRGHRRNESTCTFTPPIIPKMPTTVKHEDLIESQFESERELTPKEVHCDEKKDIDETEKIEYEVKTSTFETEYEGEYTDYKHDRPHSQISKSDSESHRATSVTLSDDRPEPELTELLKHSSETTSEPIERPTSPEPIDLFEKSESPEMHISGRESELEFSSPYPKSPDYQMSTNLEFESSKEQLEQSIEHTLRKDLIKDFSEKDGESRSRHVSTSSEKSSFEEAEAEAVFHMVPHISPGHQAKSIGTIPEDEDAEKQEIISLSAIEEEKRQKHSPITNQSSSSIPDIMVTEHMTPLKDKGFRYPDLEIQEQEKEDEILKSTPQTPASISSKSSEETDQGREYVLNDTDIIQEEPEFETQDDRVTTESKSEISGTVIDKTVFDTETKEPSSPTESPTSDSFEILDKPDITDDFVVIEEIGKEANETDAEGKSVAIKTLGKYIRKHDEEVEEYLVKSAPAKMTGLKYYPDGSSSDELGPFEFEDSPPTVDKKSSGTKANKDDYEYDRELEASKKWIEMQFQPEQGSLISAGYGYEMEFERAPLEDIKEEEIADFDPSSRIGSLSSQKESGGSYSSVKDSFSSTPEYDVLAGRKFFTRSGEHDDISMSSLQEFENLEQAISLENRRFHHGSQDSLSNGSFSRRYHISRSGQGDDVSLSSLKEFEGLESACIQAHKIETIAKEEEEALRLAQIDEGHESTISESDSLATSTIQKKIIGESDEEDYEKRMFEIDEIIRQAQSNVEQFIDLKLGDDKTQSLGRGDSIEEVAKIPDLDLDAPTSKISTISSLQSHEEAGVTSTDSLEIARPGFHASTDSLDLKTTGDVMTASTDSIEFQTQSKTTKDVMTDSIEHPDVQDGSLIASDSLELASNIIVAQTEVGASYGNSLSGDTEIETNLQDQCSDIMLGSTDSLEPTSSTATHATYHFETDSVLSSSFTSGGSNTMVSSTDTIDPNGTGAQTIQGMDLAAAIRQVWSGENSYAEDLKSEPDYTEHETKPFVTEVIEPCDEDGFSVTIHRMVNLPPEIQRVTFKGPDAEQQYQKYIETFGEGQFVQETEHVDADGNVHIQKVIQNRVVMKDLSPDKLQNMSEEELKAYVQQKISKTQEKYFTESSTTIHKETDIHTEESELDKDYKHLLTSITGDTTRLEGPSTEIVAHRTYVTRHVTPAIIDIQGTETEQEKSEEKTDEKETEEVKSESEEKQTTGRPRPAGSQHELSEEMRALLAEMEEQSKR